MLTNIPPPFTYFQIKYPGLKPAAHQSFIRVETASLDAEWDEMCADGRTYPFTVFDDLNGTIGDYVRVNMSRLRRVRDDEAAALATKWEAAVSPASEQSEGIHPV